MGKEAAGGIVGTMNYGKIVSSHVDGSVTGVGGESYAGGIIGRGSWSGVALVANSYSRARLGEKQYLIGAKSVVGHLLGFGGMLILTNSYAVDESVDGGNGSFGLVGARREDELFAMDDSFVLSGRWTAPRKPRRRPVPWGMPLSLAGTTIPR